MVLPRVCRAAAVVTSLALFLAGCSRDLPTSSSSAVAGKTAAVGPSATDGIGRPGRAVTILLPKAMASIRRMPEMGVLDGGGIRGDMISDYFRTTGANRQFRRGFAEFAIPEFSEGFFGARVVLRESRAWTAYSLPPDRHELSAYTDVDFAVSTSEIDRPTSPLGTFETDANEDVRTFTFDVSDLVSGLRGAGLGLRVKLEADPTYTGTGFLGSGFGGSSTPAGVVIEVITTVPAAIGHLEGMIEGMIEGQVLPAGMKATLLGRLQRAEDIVKDDNPGNDRSACPVLSAIIDDVDSAFRNGSGFAAPEAFYIMESVENIKTGLDCAGRSIRDVGRGRHDPVQPVADAGL
ncbi:MAG TPA: hypothetical protein VGK89_01955 [Candidatus Eisenbacteria bacterium]|jgi:hypothetical protein